jgi:ribosome biogenesis GTPase
VVTVHRGELDVATEGGLRRVRVPGRFAHDGTDVAVGDWIALAGDSVDSVLPRRSAIVRNAAGRATRVQTLVANIDLAFVVTSMGPELETRRIERYLVTIWESGASPEIVLTKADRIDDRSGYVAEVEAAAIGVPVHVVSAKTGEGCDELRARIVPGVTAVLLGSSGVGKSTLVNRFVGSELMETRETREDDDEGRHTTTHRELILLPGGGIVIDTPGLRELQLAESAAGLDTAFADVEELASGCRFNDCAHEGEPGCAVLAGVEDGSLAQERLDSWRKLQRELRAIAARNDHLLRKEQTRRWKLLSREGKARSRPR